MTDFVRSVPVCLIVLAAGHGTRMNSDLPKVLHKLGSAPLLHHAMHAGRALAPKVTVVVTGHGAEAVSKSAREFDADVRTVLQAPQKGTAHAVLKAASELGNFHGDALVLYGDTPLIRRQTLAAMLAARREHAVVVLGFHASDPGRYGRLIARNGSLDRIVEWKDAGEDERAVNLCNSGVICADAATLVRLCAAVSNTNAAGEYYLTDIVALARSEGMSAGVVLCDESETIGVNTRAQLAQAEATFQARARAEAMESGVTLTAPETVYFALDTVIGRDAVIGPAVIFGMGVTVEPLTEVRGFCHLEGCVVGRGADVGPFARIRPGTQIDEGVHIGNFVEIKNSNLSKGAKVGHLTYLGDTLVGERTNIGAGTITCNFDGVMKHRTVIGSDAFIGSDTMLVAPVKVGDGALRECLKLCVSDRAHAVVRYVQASKRPANSMAS